MRLSIYLTGGLGGIALFGDVAADVLNGQELYRALFLTLAFSAAALLGLGYSGFEWAATQLERLIEDKVVNRNDTFDRKRYPPPTAHDYLYRGGFLLVVGTAGCLLIAAWTAT